MTAANTAKLSAAAGVNVVPFRLMSGDAHVVRLTTPLTVAQAEAAARLMMQDPAIQYAVPDRIATAQAIPNDTFFANQWHYFAPASAVGGSNLVSAWNRTTGVLAQSVVAVIDTGILPHADLAGKVLPGYDFISDIAMANDGNGRDANAADPGDWVVGRNSSWHGTHVAGTIGAASNNGAGVAGANWNARIVPVRVIGKGGGLTSDILDGLRWAAGVPVPGVPNNANPAKVINMSLGGAMPCDYAYQSAITDVLGVGATVVAAAGNNNVNISGFSPAGCAGVITVASNTRAGGKATYSNFGMNVTVAAPGGDGNAALPSNNVLSTFDGGLTTPLGDNVYAWNAGTSMAAPHVAGIISLMRSVRPTLNPTEIKRIIQTTARPFPAGSTCSTFNCGAGIVDADTAVAVAAGGALLKGPVGTFNVGMASVGSSWSNSTTLSNGGLVPVTITAITPSAGFTTTGCIGVLPVGQTCTLNIRFTPTVAGVKTGTIAIASTSVKSANFAVSGTGVNEIFPPMGRMPVGWVNSALSNAAWRVNSNFFAEGATSLQAGVIGNSQNSSIEVTKTALFAGNVNFKARVSSEAGFDFLRFYVDGVQKWSGSGTTALWTVVSVPVTPGVHTYKWSYTKDVSNAVGLDSAWIDSVVLP